MTDDRWLYAWTLGYAAVGAASLLVPLYAIELGAGPFLVGLLVATIAFAGIPGALVWGRVARRSGARGPLAVFALLATAAVLAVVPQISISWTVVLANAGLWFAVAAAAPVLDLLAVEGVPEGEWERRIARVQAYRGYGWIAGLLAGAVWSGAAGATLGTASAQRTFFWVCAGGAALGAVLVALWKPSDSTVSEERFRRAYRGFDRQRLGAGRFGTFLPFVPGGVYWAMRARDRGFASFPSTLKTYLVAVTLFAVGSAAFWAPMPALLAELGYADARVFGLFVVAGLGSGLLYARAGEWALVRDLRWLHGGALGLRAVLFPLVVLGALFLSGTLQFAAIAVLLALVGATWAVVAVTTTGLVGRLAPAESGDALGTCAALVGVGGGVGSLLGGLLAGTAGYLIAFVAAGGLVLVGAALGLASGRNAVSPSVESA